MDLTGIKKELSDLPRTHFGISVPHLRKLAQKIARDDFADFLRCNDYSSFELKLLHAFTIGYVKADIKTLLAYFAAFVPYATSWELTDSLCQNFKIARQYPQEVWNFLKPYQKSSQEFESRIVSVMMLSHFLNDKYIDRVIEISDRLNTDAYYAQMGMAWAIATIMGKYPDRCLSYLQSANCHLDKITYNKSLQKIRESFRVSAEIKELTKTLSKT